jgi:hypothetical protein
VASTYFRSADLTVWRDSLIHAHTDHIGALRSSTAQLWPDTHTIQQRIDWHLRCGRAPGCAGGVLAGNWVAAAPAPSRGGGGGAWRRSRAVTKPGGVARHQHNANDPTSRHAAESWGRSIRVLRHRIAMSRLPVGLLARRDSLSVSVNGHGEKRPCPLTDMNMVFGIR